MEEMRVAGTKRKGKWAWWVFGGEKTTECDVWVVFFLVLCRVGSGRCFRGSMNLSATDGEINCSVALGVVVLVA